MDTHILEEVLECLQGERTLFHYYRDAYATYLLRRAISEKQTIALRELRQSKWSSLLNRPVIRDITARCGNGHLQTRELGQIWVSTSEPFVLTLGTWGEGEYEWDQISRPGQNLVLQLNLCNRWQRAFRTLVRESANEFFGYGHPLSRTRQMTLAWARMDFDFNTNEVLIEEIQTDLLRDMDRMKKLALIASKNDQEFFNFYGYNIPARAFTLFSDNFLGTFKNIWHEAMLTAAISFAFDELGIKNLYYHTFETGSALKNIDYRKPPRSLYSELPRRFCFETTNEAPEFLQRDRRARRKLKKLKDCSWFHMVA